MMMSPTPKPGDVLFRPKGPFTHTGIYMPGGLVFDNAPERGEGLVSWQGFSQGQPVAFRSVSSLEALQNVQRVRVMLANPRPYTLLDNNCQDSVTKAVGLLPHSWERNGVLLALTALAGLALLSRR